MHLAVVTASVRVAIDRALYLPKDWAADEERPEVAGVPCFTLPAMTDEQRKRLLPSPSAGASPVRAPENAVAAVVDGLA